MLKKYTPEDLTAILAIKYNLTASIKSLGAYEDQNYLIITSDKPSKKYVLKITNAKQKESLMKIQNHALSCIKKSFE